MKNKAKPKIKFIRDYAPRKKGEVAELEAKLAEFYLSNGIAVLTGTPTKEKGGCEDCDKTKQTTNKIATVNKAPAKAKADLKKANK